MLLCQVDPDERFNSAEVEAHAFLKVRKGSKSLFFYSQCIYLPAGIPAGPSCGRALVSLCCMHLQGGTTATMDEKSLAGVHSIIGDVNRKVR